MRRLLTAVLLIPILVSGCTKEEPPPPPPPQPVAELPPPDRTPDQYYGEMQDALKPLFDAYEMKSQLTDPDRDIAIQKLQTLLPQVKATENGRVAMGKMMNYLKEATAQSRKEDEWRKVKAFCMAYLTLDPANERFIKLNKDADIIRNRPRVKLQGFFNVEGEVFAFVQVTNVDTGTNFSYKVREGEIFHEVLRLNRIVGNQAAAEFEYLPAEYSWQEKSPANQR